MKVLIDTNVILDSILQRKPFQRDSEGVLKLCERGLLEGYITANTVTDLFYFAQKRLNNDGYSIVLPLLHFLNIINVSKEDINKALDIHSDDFEDCLQFICSKNVDCDYIITRNIKDFVGFSTKSFRPREFLRYFRKDNNFYYNKRRK